MEKWRDHTWRESQEKLGQFPDAQHLLDRPSGALKTEASLGCVRFWDGVEWNGTIPFLEPILVFDLSEECERTFVHFYFFDLQ
jgi:hypothetical protein